MKKDSGDNDPSEFESSFESDSTCFIMKYSKYKHCTKNLVRNSKSDEINCHEIKITTEFNVVLYSIA